MFTCEWAWPARSPIRPILGFWGSKVRKNGRLPALTPMNRTEKFDAASFILGRETVTVQIHKKTNTNSNRYPHLAYRHVWIKSSEMQNTK